MSVIMRHSCSSFCIEQYTQTPDECNDNSDAMLMPVRHTTLPWRSPNFCVSTFSTAENLVGNLVEVTFMPVPFGFALTVWTTWQIRHRQQQLFQFHPTIILIIRPDVCCVEPEKWVMCAVYAACVSVCCVLYLE